MSDALNPTGPAQPDLSDAYTAPGNPATKEPFEETQASAIASDSSTTTDKRIPARQASYSDATPTSMARGVHGVDPADYKDKEDLMPDGTTHDSHSQTDQMQMGAPGEGKVHDAVVGGHNSGASRGAQPGLEEGLERKKEEQARARAEILGRQKGAARQGGAKGQTGGPANPVGNQNNYPNAGSDY